MRSLNCSGNIPDLAVLLGREALFCLYRLNDFIVFLLPYIEPNLKYRQLYRFLKEFVVEEIVFDTTPLCLLFFFFNMKARDSDHMH